MDGHMHKCMNEQMRVFEACFGCYSHGNSFAALHFSFISSFYHHSFRHGSWSFSVLRCMGGDHRLEMRIDSRGTEQQAIAFLPYLILDG